MIVILFQTALSRHLVISKSQVLISNLIRGRTIHGQSDMLKIKIKHTFGSQVSSSVVLGEPFLTTQVYENTGERNLQQWPCMIEIAWVDLGCPYPGSYKQEIPVNLDKKCTLDRLGRSNRARPIRQKDETSPDKQFIHESAYTQTYGKMYGTENISSYAKREAKIPYMRIHCKCIFQSL